MIVEGRWSSLTIVCRRIHLCSVVFAPNVKHEHAGDEQQGHDQDRHRTPEKPEQVIEEDCVMKKTTTSTGTVLVVGILTL